MQAEEDKGKAEKERDEAEQHGYDVGVAETEDALRAESPRCVAPTVPRPEKRLSTRLGLKLHLNLGDQKKLSFLQPCRSLSRLR